MKLKEYKINLNKAMKHEKNLMNLVSNNRDKLIEYIELLSQTRQYINFFENKIKELEKESLN